MGGRERWAAATSRCSHTIRVYNQKMDISQQEYEREHQGNPIICDRATDFVPLRHIAALSFPQPTNLRRLPGPPVYIFWGDGKPPWLGGPKAHTPHDILIHVGFESFRFLFVSGSHGNGTSPPYPSTHADTIQGIRVQAPPQVL